MTLLLAVSGASSLHFLAHIQPCNTADISLTASSDSGSVTGVNSNTATIFSPHDCPYCAAAHTGLLLENFAVNIKQQLPETPKAENTRFQALFSAALQPARAPPVLS